MLAVKFLKLDSRNSGPEYHRIEIIEIKQNVFFVSQVVVMQNYTALLDICHQSHKVHKPFHAQMDVLVFQNINAKVDLLTLAKLVDNAIR